MKYEGADDYRVHNPSPGEQPVRHQMLKSIETIIGNIVHAYHHNEQKLPVHTMFKLGNIFIVQSVHIITFSDTN